MGEDRRPPRRSARVATQPYISASGAHITASVSALFAMRPQERRLERLTSRFDRALSSYSSNDRCKYTPELDSVCLMNKAG